MKLLPCMKSTPEKKEGKIMQYKLLVPSQWRGDYQLTNMGWRPLPLPVTSSPDGSSTPKPSLLYGLGVVYYGQAELKPKHFSGICSYPVVTRKESGFLPKVMSVSGEDC